MNLDKYQEQAVLAEGNILLIAGAGSGKTFTIVQKVNYLINNLHYKEEEILIISFTNKSVEDIKKKIYYSIDIMTFHKLAISILQDYNIEYNLVTDDYLLDTINNFFYNLNDDELILEILKYFKEYSYSKFLNSYKYKEFTKLINTFIKIYKTNACSKEDFKKIYYKDSFLSKYIYIIMCIYEKNLIMNDALDFDDLITKATNILDKPYKYKYIIIDEFQDTSRLRFNLVNKLRIINKAFLFVVGDDYQSIYHFSGCDINIFLNFTKYVDNAKELRLKYTYRNSQELIDICSMFITKNKMQIKKELVSPKHLDKPIVLIYYKNPKKAFKKLYHKLLNIDQDILVLGRNNADIKEFSDDNVNYLTVHSSKGLEANNVILINLTDRIYGFPNKIVNNRLLEEMHPSDRSIMYAEERRLFYVALTRTKERVYLLVPYQGKSIFVKELKKYIKRRK